MRSRNSWLPKDLEAIAQSGGGFTILSYVFMLVVFVLEFRAFMHSPTFTTLAIDRNDDKLLQINFDVEVHWIECRNLKVMVFDAFGKEPLNRISNDFTYRPIDKNGQWAGESYKASEIQAEEARQEILKEESQKDLDADWSSSHDGFQHKSFEHVIQVHEFTLINFFAEWCIHCRQFHPTWSQIANNVNDKQTFPDKDGEQRVVRLLKMNCVDFQENCKQQKIEAFPALRLYKTDGSFTAYEGRRNEKDIVDWISKTVGTKTFGWNTRSATSEKGCNIRGHLHVPRVPGHLEFMTGMGDQTLNPTMTNVSHTIRHLSFSDPDDGAAHRKAWLTLPHDVLNHVSPLDGMRFATQGFHQAYQHYLKVVSVLTLKGDLTYQFSHADRISHCGVKDVPQARIFYDFEPFSVHIKRKDDKRWYDFITNLLAKLGGLYVVIHLVALGLLGKVTNLNKAHLY